MASLAFSFPGARQAQLAEWGAGRGDPRGTGQRGAGPPEDGALVARRSGGRTCLGGSAWGREGVRGGAESSRSALVPFALCVGLIWIQTEKSCRRQGLSGPR